MPIYLAELERGGKLRLPLALTERQTSCEDMEWLAKPSVFKLSSSDLCRSPCLLLQWRPSSKACGGGWEAGSSVCCTLELLDPNYIPCNQRLILQKDRWKDLRHKMNRSLYRRK